MSVLGEFGGLGMPVPRPHLAGRRRTGDTCRTTTREELTDAYVSLLTEMRPLIGRGLSAAVYTQTTDVEIEVNGLMTYDRELVKMDEARIAEAARKLYLPPPRGADACGNEREVAADVALHNDRAGGGLAAGRFRRQRVEVRPGRIRHRRHAGRRRANRVERPDIWLRRTFELDSLPEDGDIMLNIHHDEDAEVYLNGKLVRRLRGHTQGYRPVVLSDDARQPLKPAKTPSPSTATKPAAGSISTWDCWKCGKR